MEQISIDIVTLKDWNDKLVQIMFSTSDSKCGEKKKVYNIADKINTELLDAVEEDRKSLKEYYERCNRAYKR